MNIDNILRTMNEYINDIFSTFGGQSVEYSAAVKQVRDNIPQNVLEKVTRTGLHYSGDKPTEPIQFSRGKAAKEILSAFTSDLGNLRSEQRESGTAAGQAQRYYTEQKIANEDIPVSKKKMKQQAQQRYNFNQNINDWYDKIMQSEKISDDEKEAFKDLYSTLHSDYSDAAVRENIASEAMRLLNEDYSQADDNIIEASANIEGVASSLDKII